MFLERLKISAVSLFGHLIQNRYVFGALNYLQDFNYRKTSAIVSTKESADSANARLAV